MLEAVHHYEEVTLDSCAADIEELLQGLASISDGIHENTWISLSKDDGDYSLSKREYPSGAVTYSVLYRSHPDASGVVESHQYDWRQEGNKYVFSRRPEHELHLSTMSKESIYELAEVNSEQIQGELPTIISTFFTVDRNQIVHNAVNVLTD